MEAIRPPAGPSRSVQKKGSADRPTDDDDGSADRRRERRDAKRDEGTRTRPGKADDDDDDDDHDDDARGQSPLKVDRREDARGQRSPGRGQGPTPLRGARGRDEGVRHPP